MSRVTMIALTLILISAAASPQGGTIPLSDEVCFYRTDVPPPTSATRSLSSDESLQEQVLELVFFAGLQPDFIVGELDVPNAAAFIFEKERYIAYSVGFMNDMETKTKTEWSSYSIMAHEMGHHYQGHTVLEGGSFQSIELEADEFSGFILAQMGATVEQAKATMAILAPVKVSAEDSHPNRATRLAAITKGWDRGRLLMKAQAEHLRQENQPDPAPAENPKTPTEKAPPTKGVSRVWAVDSPSSGGEGRDPETFKFVERGDRLTVAAISPSGEIYLYRGEIMDGLFTVISESEKLIRRGNTVKVKDVMEGVVTGDTIAVSRRYFMDDQLVGNSSWKLKPYRAR